MALGDGGCVLILREVLNKCAQGVLAAHAERRYARQASARLLELYKTQHREHRELNPRALYQSIVAQRLGPQASRAAEVIRRAEESFTDWPVDRELKFRDVVHYLIFDEYTRMGMAREGTKTNMGVVVARVIPDDI